MSARLKLVYRVEDAEDAHGPYQSLHTSNDLQEQIVREMGDAHTADMKYHPIPWNDGIEGPSFAEHCGFSNRRQMRQWFKGWGQMLSDAGFVVRAFKVHPDDVREGGRQVVFRRHDYEPIATYDPATLIAA